MKLFYVTHARVPGIKAHCSQIAQMNRSFLNTGVDIELVLPQRADRPAYRNKTIHGWYGFDSEIPSKNLPCIDFISGTPAGLPQIVYRLAFRLMVWTFNRSLVRYLKKQEKNFILYSRDIHIFSKLIRKFPLVKKVIELHLLEERPGSTQKIENRVFDACNGFIVVTTPMKDLLIKRGYDANKILVEPNGVDMKAFPGTAGKKESRQKLGLPQSARIVLFLGNFHALGVSRGLDTIVHAAPSILEEYEDTLFLFVGGPMQYAEPYIDMFKKLGISDKNFTFLDRQPYDQIHQWLAAADILVHPLPSNPIYDKITSPLKVLEYMTSSRPMVVSNLPSLREMLVDEKNVLFVPPSNATEFSKAIIRLFDDPVLAESLAKQAREDVQPRSWDARAKRISSWMNTLN